MGLRLAEGIDPRRYAALSGRSLSAERLADLVELGLVALEDGRVRATPGWGARPQRRGRRPRRLNAGRDGRLRRQVQGWPVSRWGGGGGGKKAQRAAGAKGSRDKVMTAGQRATQTHFGAASVWLDDKQGLVDEVFRRWRDATT